MRFEHWFYAVPLRLRSLFRRGRVEQELDEEFQYHLEHQIQEHTAKGMTPDEARYAALRALGGLEQRKEECRDMRHVSLIENLLQDVRYGLRVLRRNPGFTTVAVLSLALGVGANTAVFSLINAVMLKSLPVESPEQLVRFAWGNPGHTTGLFTYPLFEQLRDHGPGFSDVLAWESTRFYVGRGEITDRIEGLSVSGNYYSARCSATDSGSECLPVIQARVFVFAATVALLTALFFGMAPALRASRYRATGVLRESGRGIHSGTRRWGLGKMLVALQMALSLLLLVGAGLFVRSLAKLASLDVGFRQDSLLLVVVDGERTRQKGAPLEDFYQQAVDRVASLPGVYSASLSSRTPVGGDFWNSMISVEGSPHQVESMYVYFYRIGPGFFRTFGTPLLSGRDFGPQDNEGSRRVAIINESVAKSYFPSQNPLGRLISAPQDPERRDMEVTGIVKDAKYSTLREPRSHTIYLPYRQHLKRLRGVTISVRADPAVKEVGDLAKAIRREISSLNPEVAMTFRTMTEQVNQQLLEERLIATLSAFFGLLALLLASVGLYGVMAYTIERRTWEVGVRMALGARRSDVVWLVFRETLALVALGAFIGVLAAYGASRWIGSMLFGITPADPLAFAGATVLLLASALLGSYIPAMRAARVDPMVALRYE